MAKRTLCILGGLCVQLAVGAAAQSGPIATIKDIRRSVLPDAVRIIIELDREVPFHDERIPDPMRVFVDLPGTRAAAALTDQTIRFELDADIVRQIRLGRHPNNTTRVVLDAVDVSSYSVYPLYQPFRIVIDCVRSTAVRTAAPATPGAPEAPPGRQMAPPLVARSLAPRSGQALPGRSPASARLLTSAYATLVRDAGPGPASTAPRRLRRHRRRSPSRHRPLRHRPLRLRPPHPRRRPPRT